MNLIGPGPARSHFEDCDQALAGLSPSGAWVDLGSGAGFPGLVLAEQHPTLRLDLVESRQKRSWFLQHVLDEARWSGPVRVLPARVEDLPGPYDGIVSRAFAPPPQVLASATRLLRPGGQLVLFLQDDAPDTVALQEAAGFSLEHTVRYRVEGKPRRSEVLRRVAGEAG
jgi:16S rRNA (guanine527-N7)-methyltransferase